MKRRIGPNLKRLIILKMSRDAVTRGGKEGLAEAIKFLNTPSSLSSGWKAATDWCDLAIQVIREALPPNPWKTSTEEEIAGEILRQIESRKVAQHPVMEA